MTSPKDTPETVPAETVPSAEDVAARRAAQATAQGAQQMRISESRAKAEGRAQVRPTAEGWKQAMGDDGRPQLQFTAKARVSQPPVHLADLTLAERADKLKEIGPAGLPRQAALRALLPALHHRSRADERPSQGPPRRDRRGHVPEAAHRGEATGHRRWQDHQVPLAPLRWLAGRVGAHALQQPHHAVHLLAVRLRHELPVLRHRPGRTDPQHVHRRNPGPDRPGQPRHRRGRTGRHRSTRKSAWATLSSWAWASPWPTTSA